jgi:hypothetical protein
VLQLLADGEPVTIGAAAAAARLSEQAAGQVLRSWPTVLWDDHERVAGFWGLALPGMLRRIRRAGADLSAWCAWDPLFLARVAGGLQVATADPVTGEEITYRISRDGTVDGALHPGAVLSLLCPGQPWDPDAGRSGAHPGTSWGQVTAPRAGSDAWHAGLVFGTTSVQSRPSVRGWRLARTAGDRARRSAVVRRVAGDRRRPGRCDAAR